MLKHEACRRVSFPEGPQILTSPIDQPCQIIDPTSPMSLISLLHGAPHLNKCKMAFCRGKPAAVRFILHNGDMASLAKLRTQSDHLLPSVVTVRSGCRPQQY